MSDFLDLQGAKDLNTDAIHIKAVANSVDPVTGAPIDEHVNRVGGTDYTLQGFWNALGPVVMPWTSVTGGTLTQPNQAFLHPTDKNYYSWTGAFPHVVAPGTDPTVVGSGYVPRTAGTAANLINQHNNDAAAHPQLSAEIALTNARLDDIIANSEPTEGNSELVDIRVTSSGRTMASAGAATRFQSYLYNKQVYPIAVEPNFYLHANGLKAPIDAAGFGYAEVTLPAGQYYVETRVRDMQRGLKVDGQVYPNIASTATPQDFGVSFTLYEPTLVTVSSSEGIPPKLYSVSNIQVDPDLRTVPDYVSVPGGYVNAIGGIAAHVDYNYIDTQVRQGETYEVEGYLGASGPKLIFLDGIAYPSTAAADQIYNYRVTAKADGLMRISYHNKKDFSFKQLAIDTQIEPLVIGLEAKITAAKVGINPPVALTLEPNFYLDSAGKKVSIANSSFNYAELSLPAGEYKFIGRITGSQRAVKVAGDVYPLATGSVANQPYEIKIRLHETSKVQLSSCDNVLPKIYTVTQTDVNPDFTSVPNLTWIDGSYVDSSGNLRPVAIYSYVDIQAKAGEIYFIKGRVNSSARLYYVDGQAFPTDDGPMRLEYNTVTVKADGLLRISGETSYGITVKRFTHGDMLYPILDSLDKRLDTLESGSTINYESPDFYRTLHRNVLAMGDSLTSGGNYQPPQTKEPIEECYPYYLNMLSHWIVTNAGINGYTPLLMWNNQILPGNYVGSNYDACIFWLGTNAGLTDTLAADTASGDYMTYAETNTGRYCSCIEQLLVDNPNLKIYLVKIFFPVSTALATNAVIDQIAAKYSLPVFDPNDKGALYPAPPLHTANSLHFDKIGNVVLANEIYKRVIDTIKNNLSSYNTVLLGQRTTQIFDNQR